MNLDQEEAPRSEHDARPCGLEWAEKGSCVCVVHERHYHDVFHQHTLNLHLRYTLARRQISICASRGLDGIEKYAEHETSSL